MPRKNCRRLDNKEAGPPARPEPREPPPEDTVTALKPWATDEALEDDPDAELVIFGSPALDELVSRATESGRVARAFLTVAANPSRAIAERLARAYRFHDAAWTAGAGRTWSLPAGVFLFRALPLGCPRGGAVRGRDERRRQAHPAKLGEAVERHGLAPEPPEAWPMLGELTAEAAYVAARTELERRLIVPLGARRRELQARFVRESERAAAYYGELGRELGEEIEQTPAGAPERAPREAKLCAIILEREGRLAERRAKYRLEADVSLLSPLRLYLPRLVFHGTLAGKLSVGTYGGPRRAGRRAGALPALCGAHLLVSCL